ncbi:penicillin-binding transpeptidase domain-containing protein [Streptomyces sp. RB6PN25]|uniref:Penicillin-binding transpeptidase domain-containing protein n=1 Tax=Streptomyces humicola TaxID=2953240 RepID=A0ABT1PV59_9ACTN|nr:penicillin-binding transpeptidase domain-containing protein [Streptomyces humicola]MCQ4081557.1 penicillin-binding transpeptidase domain-containing protein [Streptomyces humicola]
MRRSVRIGILVVCLALLTMAGLGVYNVWHGLAGDNTASTAPPTGTRTAAPVDPVHFAQAFLNSWAAGHYQGAASDTNDPSDAAEALQDFHDELKLTGLSFSRVAADASASPRVTFHVSAQLAGHGTWSYNSALNVVGGGGQDAVDWSPSVINPKLAAGTAVEIGAVPPSGGFTVTDENGTVLTAAAYPSLSGIFSTLASRPGEAGQGRNGTGVIAVNADGGGYVATLDTFTPPVAGAIRTTLDAHLQAAAEQAVAQASHGGTLDTGLVAIDPRNGHIKAIAESPAGGFDWALSGAYPPGSTMKIITSAALLDKGAVTATTPLPCPSHYAVDGKDFTNSEGEASPSFDLTDDFAHSCNTAFISLHDKLTDDDLATTARNDFGIGLGWNIGVASAEGQIPTAAGDEVEKAADMIGQGQVLMSPLLMASVGATVQSGTFRQPILLPGLPQQSAPGALPPGTDAALQQMMSATAERGTAAPRMQGIEGGGAKTGTAEVQGQNPDGWFVAYDHNLAVAAVVTGGGYGYTSAGYPVRAVLLAGQ